MAPSAGNLQTWAFVVVTDRDQIEAVALAYQEAGQQYIRDGVLMDPDLGADVAQVAIDHEEAGDHKGDIARGGPPLAPEPERTADQHQIEQA